MIGSSTVMHIGDIVAFTQSFINQHGLHDRSMATAHGTVMAVHAVNGAVLAEIEWSMPGLPRRVNVKNLITVKAAAS